MGRPSGCRGVVLVLLSLLALTAADRGIKAPIKAQGKSDEAIHKGIHNDVYFQDQLKLLAVNNVIILSQTSCAFLQFAANWIQHAQGLGVTNFLIITEDQASMDWLEKRAPGHAASAEIFTGLAIPESGPEFVDWGSKQFATFTCIRPTYIQKVLSEGYTVLWSDMDTVWHKNPFDYMPTLYEFIGVDDQEFEFYESISPYDTNYTCTCFLYMKDTPRVRGLLEAWDKQCKLGTSKDDQFAFRDVFEGKIREELDYYIMPRQLFPTGEMSEIEEMRTELNFKINNQNRGHTWQDPVWTHANFRVGRTAKYEFFNKLMIWEFDDPLSLPHCAIMPEADADAGTDAADDKDSKTKSSDKEPIKTEKTTTTSTKEEKKPEGVLTITTHTTQTEMTINQKPRGSKRKGSRGGFKPLTL